MAISTLNRFKNIFMRFGKIIKISQIPGPVVLSLQTAHMGLVDQTASGAASEFDTSLDVVNPLGSQIRSVNGNLNNLTKLSLAAFDKYLRSFVAVEMGLSPNATNAEIQSALQTQLNAVTGTFATVVSNANGFAAYFLDNFNITLPTSGSPSIPDAYITDAVVTEV